jgi:Polyketide cyclase / dehydrase and lipid transport
MMKYEAAARTAKPAEQVWALLVDVERWPELVDTYQVVQRLDAGPLRVGSRAHVEQVGLRPGDWQVSDLSEGHSFTWKRKQPGVVVVAWHRVDPEPGGCRLTLGVQMDGPLSGLIGILLGGKTRRYVDLELARFTASGDVVGS